MGKPKQPKTSKELEEIKEKRRKTIEVKKNKTRMAKANEAKKKKKIEQTVYETVPDLQRQLQQSEQDQEALKKQMEEQLSAIETQTIPNLVQKLEMTTFELENSKMELQNSKMELENTKLQYDIFKMESEEQLSIAREEIEKLKKQLENKSSRIDDLVKTLKNVKRRKSGTKVKHHLKSYFELSKEAKIDCQNDMKTLIETRFQKFTSDELRQLLIDTFPMLNTALKSLSPEETYQYQNELNLTSKAMDKARNLHKQLGFNPFSPKNQVTAFRKSITFQTIGIEGDVPVRMLTNIREIINQRIAVQISNENFQHLTENKYFIGLSIDRGGEYILFTISLGSCRNINSPKSMILIGLMKGKENRENLQLFENLYQQLKELKSIIVDQEETEVIQFLNCDLKMDKLLLGLRSGHSKNPCVVCEDDAEGIFKCYKETTGKLRNYEVQNAEISQDLPALIDWIPANRVCVPFLHTLLGIVPKILNELKLELMKKEQIDIVDYSYTEEEQDEIDRILTKIEEIQSLHDEWLNFYNAQNHEEDEERSSTSCDSDVCIGKLKNATIPKRVPRKSYKILDVVKSKKKFFHTICQTLSSDSLKKFKQKEFVPTLYGIEEIETTVLAEIKQAETEGEDVLMQLN
uniref:Uncharacterized protein n=1 Tax=Panagrolaimus sp. JU765 TaxID=591449 RepID=A0AC34RB20_9BILA